jgi:hypothetical protein
MFGTDHLLRRLIELTEEQLLLDWENNRLLRRIAKELAPEPVTGFTFTQENPMLPFAPGSSPVITITPLPAGVQLTQAVPTTVSSDPVNYPISVDSTGLIVTIAIPTTATVGAPAATLTTSYTNADGTVATSTSQPFGSIVAAVTDVTGFTFEQTA